MFPPFGQPCFILAPPFSIIIVRSQKSFIPPFCNFSPIRCRDTTVTGTAYFLSKIKTCERLSQETLFVSRLCSRRLTVICPHGCRRVSIHNVSTAPFFPHNGDAYSLCRQQVAEIVKGPQKESLQLFLSG